MRTTQNVLSTMGLTLKSTPLKVKLIGKQHCEVGIVPSDEFTVMGLFMAQAGILCVLMKEWK